MKPELMLLYVPILVWVSLLIIYFMILANKYTFGNWTKDNRNPYEDETLGLPKGTFRGILTLTIMFVAIMLEIFTLNDTGNNHYENSIAKFMTAFQMVLAFYFGSQVMSTLTKAETEKTEAISGKLSEDDKPQNTDDSVGSNKKS